MVSAMGLCRIMVGLAAGAALACGVGAQEPSAASKQADADYRAGVAALGRNDLKTALADFQSVVKLAPSVEQGHSALGAVLLETGRLSEGIHELELALRMKPGDGNAQMNLALGYEKSGQAAKSLPLFAKVEAAAHAEKKPLPATVLAPYARALAGTGQFEAATAKMREAAGRDPKNGEIEDELGSIYAHQQDWAHAREAFDTAVKLKPDSAMAHLHLGLAMSALQLPGAMDELTAADRLAPDNPVIAVEFGSALAGAGQDERAIAVLEHAMQLDPGAAVAEYPLGLALQRMGRVEEAIPLLEKVADSHPKDGEVLTNLGMALCQVQRAKDAVPILQRAVALSPENATAHQDLAAAFIQLSQYQDAVEQMRMALKLSPDAPQLHYNLGLALKMEDDAQGAIPELEIAEKLDGTAPEPPYMLGVLYLQVGRYADAARELSASLKLRPANGDGWATLGSVYNKLDQLPEAASALREAIRQLPQQPDPHLTLAAVLVKQNQPAEAAAERKTAAELMRGNMNRQRAEVATHSAESQLKSGQVDDAIAQFREALSYDADYAEAHAGLASALERQGKTLEAAAERQKAQKSGAH